MWLLLFHMTLPGLISSIVIGGSNDLGPGSSPKSSPTNRQPLNIGLIVPHSQFMQRKYTAAINKAVIDVKETNRRFVKKFKFTGKQIHLSMMKVNPSPTVILSNLCEEFLPNNVSAIIYMTNSETFGRSTAASQYFLQLAGYLGIPVIAWNADNSGLERRSQSRLRIQLAPSLEHQVAAMLAILVRYNWQMFSVVTSDIAGHDDFIQAVRDKHADMKKQEIFNPQTSRIQAEVKVTSAEHMEEVVNSETRILLLYSTKGEGNNILMWAREAGLTSSNYVWIVTQSVIGESVDEEGQAEAGSLFPIGMLGVSFATSLDSMIKQIPLAIEVFGQGVDDFLDTPTNKNLSLIPHLSCQGNDGLNTDIEARWAVGETFNRHLRAVSVQVGGGKPDIRFLPDGTLEAVELKIMNLRRGVKKGSGSPSQLLWEKIGLWKSQNKENHGLDIKDIVWPGDSHVPPQGVPEKFHLTVGFLEEPPFINVAPPDPVTGKCNVDRGTPCKAKVKWPGSNDTLSPRNFTEDQCCSGFCIDLLEKFSKELHFDFDLIQEEDQKWGTALNGKWNGLMAALVSKKFDMVLTSLKINREREEVVDFTAPFMESGTAVVVAKRTGIISPTAFLEPFDMASWALVGLAAVQLSALTIFLFEWISPAGYNMKTSPDAGHKFSLMRTYWLVWALLFQAPVQMDCPRAFTARWMASVWALFAVVFLAIYTANLAAFMITREEWDDFKGIDDPRLSNPMSLKPPLKFGTVPWTYTENALRKHFPGMHSYMSKYSRTSVKEGIMDVKRGVLDAFVYDGTVLEYLVGQDEECRLLTTGNWYAMTGYGVAFPRNSKHFNNFNKKVMEWNENGDLERSRRFWLTGTCKPKKEEKRSSEPLAPEQFTSAFVLLCIGVFLSVGLMLLEHVYFKYVRNRITRKDNPGCCALVSLTVGKTLTFKGAVYEASELIKSHKCQDPVCDNHLWKVKHELDLAKMKLSQLQTELDNKQRIGNPITSSNYRHSYCGDLNENVEEEDEEDEERSSLIFSEEEDSNQIYQRTVHKEISEIETVL